MRPCWNADIPLYVDCAVQNWFGEYKCKVNIDEAISQNRKVGNEWVHVFSNV